MEMRATSSLGTYPPGSFRAVLSPVPFRHGPQPSRILGKLPKSVSLQEELIKESVVGNPAQSFQAGGVAHVPSDRVSAMELRVRG